MALFDLNGTGWIPEEKSSIVVREAAKVSVVEGLARRENMGTDTKGVPRFVGDDPVVVQKGADYPDATPTADEVLLVARKWGKILNIAEEDLNDSLADVLTEYKMAWASRWARKFDNACLGVSAAGNGSEGTPYNSLYHEVTTNASANHLATASAAAVSFDDLNDALALVETGEYFDAANTAFIIHPKVMGDLRNLKDAGGQRVTFDANTGVVTGILGYPIVVSTGAAVSATASASPTGNPLVIVGNPKNLINGVRSGIESLLSRDQEFRSDGVLLKVRARRGFAVARPEAFAVIEKTA